MNFSCLGLSVTVPAEKAAGEAGGGQKEREKWCKAGCWGGGKILQIFHADIACQFRWC